MAKSHWSPDPHRLESARATLRTVPGVGRPTPERVVELLAAAGTLRALHDEPNARALLDAALPFSAADALALALPALSPEALETTVLDAVDAAPALGLGGADESAARDRVFAALATRDRFELALLGAECLAGGDLPLELETALAFFEQTLRPELYRLVPLGTQRTDALRWVAPELRARFWWREQGANVPIDGLDHLSAAAFVIARFPEARAALEAMVAAQAKLDRATSARAVSLPQGVVSLREWAARRTRRSTAPAPGHERLAVGFAAGETVLVRREGFTVSFAEPDQLLVDLLGERAGDASPTLAPAGGGAPVAGEEVPDCLDRFRFTLRGGLDAAGSFRLRVPLAGGVAEVDLPADDD